VPEKPADLLLQLMEIQSPTGEEGAIARFLHERLGQTGRPAVLDGKSVLIPPPPPDGRPMVLLAGHSDTVPPSGNAKPRRDGETIWGRGAVDMKGGLAVMISLLDDPAIGRGWARVGAIFYSGEEGSSDGNDLRRLLAKGTPAAEWALSADLAVVLEPTGGAIEVACVGVVNAEVVFRGTSCHSARPWLGRSAVDEALPFLSRIAAFSPRDHDVAGFIFRETAVVTMLRAGTARNVVPGELVANLNYRFPPGWDPERARAAVSDLTAGAAEVRISEIGPSGTIPFDRPLFATFLERSGCTPRAKQGWTDVARFGALGVPALNFGPGDPGLCHTDDERTTIGALDACRSTLAAFLTGEGPFGSRQGD
jgi:succinyl-diaminopimelate desuccinylase